jgi:hypothetical protein
MKEGIRINNKIRSNTIENVVNKGFTIFPKSTLDTTRNNKFHYNLDTDGDRVYDFKDCRPFDPKRQHSGPSEFKLTTEESYVALYKKLVKRAIMHFDSAVEVVKLAKSVAKKSMERKKQLIGELGFEEEDIPHYLKVSYYVPTYYEDVENKKSNSDTYSVASIGFSPTFGPKKVFLEIWDTNVDVYMYVDASGYVHNHMTFKYSGPVSDDIYHVRGEKMHLPKLLLVVRGVDKEKLGGDFDKFFSFVYNKMKPLG